MGMDCIDLDAFEEKRCAMSSRYEFLRLDGESLEICQDWDKDYLEFLHNIFDKLAKEEDHDKDSSDKGHDHFVASVGKSENEDDDDPQHTIIDKSVKEGSEEDTDLSLEDLNDNDHIVDSVGKSENENSDYDDSDYKYFLSHVKGNGKSFTFEVKLENGLSKIIEYLKERPIDGGLNANIHENDDTVERKRKRKRKRKRRSEPKKSEEVKKNSLRSSSLKKTSTPSHKHASKKQTVSRFQPKSNKDGLGQMSDEQQEKSLDAVRLVIKKEQDPLVEEDYQHFLNSAEIVSGRINLPLKSNKKIVYDEQVDLGDVLCDEVQGVSPRSSGKNKEEDDDCCQILDVGHEMDQSRRKVMPILREPFNEKEYNELWHEITKKNHSDQHKELRGGREKSFTTKSKGKSYLEQYKDLRQAIETVQDDKWKRLNILRGFFFWLKHVASSSLKPWKDAACLAVMPGSH